MPDPPHLPPPSKAFNAAKQQYLEQFGSALVTNTYLKIALLALSIVIVGLLLLTYHTSQALQHVKPLVIRVNEVGRAEAVTYRALAYQPQEPEIKYFLIQFVTRHYARIRATLREQYASSLYFLDGRLAGALIEANKKSRAIETFLTSPSEEIDIAVKNVAIDDLRTAPYTATVDFEKVSYTPQDHIELRRDAYVGHFVFIVQDHVPNDLIPINPLGLTITYFREDQAFVNASGGSR